MYSQRPKTPAGRIAWDAFKKVMGADPKEISYGHGIQYGWAWTAEDGRGSIWVYVASWSKAHCAYAQPVVDGLSAHRAGDQIDRMNDRANFVKLVERAAPCTDFIQGTCTETGGFTSR